VLEREPKQEDRQPGDLPYANRTATSLERCHCASAQLGPELEIG
jgi:hypothetical protein